jgi:hypothetical protein
VRHGEGDDLVAEALEDGGGLADGSLAARGGREVAVIHVPEARFFLKKGDRQKL